MAITEKQIPQLSQLKVLFSAPLWADQQVATLADLQSVKHLYFNKLVWVKSEATWYYYVEAETLNGITTYKWEKQSSRSEITIYDNEREYKKNDTVYTDGKIYTATEDIAENEEPLTTPNKWFCISGNTLTHTYIFSNSSSVTIATDIQNPMFTVYETINNIDKQIYPSVEKLSNTEYRFEFYKNGALYSITGLIIVK